MNTQRELDEFDRAYLECALWSSHDESTPEGGEPMDQNYEITDFAPEALEKLLGDCAKFKSSAAWVAVLAAEEAAEADAIVKRTANHTIAEAGGHDFWLTRNGHGAGFWDGDWAEPHATALDQLAKSFGECEMYIGDDDQIHVLGE